jgi:hypothetical protein
MKAIWKLIVTAGLLLPAAAWPQQQNLDLTDPRWELQGDATKVEADASLAGKPAVRMRSGFAYRRDVALQDGTIEFDVKLDGRRSFIYLLFRMQSDTEYEEIYLRPHKTRLPDAAQYNPAYQGRGNWQLYHGPGGTAAVELPPHTWLHVRLALQGERGALYVGETREPQLVFRPAREAKAGYIALNSFVPAGEPADRIAVRYANVVVRPGVVPPGFAALPLPPQAPVAGAVPRWKLSPAFFPVDGAVLALPADFAPRTSWVTAAAEPSALVVLGRHVTVPAKARRWATAAAVTVRAKQAGVRRFNFGYSDEVSVFLNGRLLFSGNASYSFDRPRREGLIELGQGSLYLPLAEGDNDLVLVVSDVFGGWGVMGQFESLEGLELLP